MGYDCDRDFIPAPAPLNSEPCVLRAKRLRKSDQSLARTFKNAPLVNVPATKTVFPIRLAGSFAFKNRCHAWGSTVHWAS